MNKVKPIIVIAGEPYSIFSEILFKALRQKNINTSKMPIILISSVDLIKHQMKSLNFIFSASRIFGIPHHKN